MVGKSHLAEILWGAGQHIFLSHQNIITMTSRELALQWFAGLQESEQLDLIKRYRIGVLGLDDLQPYQIELIYSRENDEHDYEHHTFYDSYQDDPTKLSEQQDYTP